MTGDDTRPVYEPGDVAYGEDPFKHNDAARPWLIISNHEGKPFHGDQYIALTLTTQSWMDGLIEIPETAWQTGGTPEQSRIVPWSVQSFNSDDFDYWQGRLENTLVDQAIEALIDYIRR